jgi:hypothetical protein
VTFFDKVFHPSLLAFRSGYGYQTALLKIIEDWKKALDENKFVAAILMDLSKAFDCLPHKLLINNNHNPIGMLTEKDETPCQRRSQSAHILLFHKILK